MNLSEKQLEIVNATEPYIAVRAAAASGKTHTLTEFARKLLRDGQDPSRIAVITYTRMAAARLVEALGRDARAEMYVGTVHSLAAYFMSKHGKGGLIKEAAENVEFDKLFKACEDIDCTNAFDWVLLDEAQDSSAEQLEFIFKSLQPSHAFVVFDDRQTIYEEASTLEDYLGDFKFYPLNENYRNKKNILNFAKRCFRHDTDKEDDSIAMYDGGHVTMMDHFDPTILDTIDPKDYKKWAFLAPTNLDITKLEAILKRKNIPYAKFKQGQITKNQLEKIMNDNVIKLLTVHSAKGLEWENVLVYDVRHIMFTGFWYRNELQYVAATRAKNNLIWSRK